MSREDTKDLIKTGDITLSKAPEYKCPKCGYTTGGYTTSGDSILHNIDNNLVLRIYWEGVDSRYCLKCLKALLDQNIPEMQEVPE